MIAGRPMGTTRYLGAPPDWKPEEQGHCAYLAVADVDTSAGPAMLSVWEPTPEELGRLNAGAKVRLWVVGRVHPPVSLDVGQEPQP